MHPFDQAIQLTATAPGTYQGHTSSAYVNLVGPYGGVTCAVMLNAVLQHPDRLGMPVALTVNFAAAVAVGPFTVTARAVRTNRSTQHWVMEASQASGVVTLATAVFATRRQVWSATETQAPQNMPLPETMVRRPTLKQPSWVQRYDMRFTEGDVFSDFKGQEQSDSRSSQWIRDDPPRPLDFASLASISDCFFPRIFLRRRRLTPVGTISITTYFHADEVALAAQGERYLIGTARGQKFHEGIFDQSGEMWSHDGHLLATTHQTVYYKD